MLDAIKQPDRTNQLANNRSCWWMLAGVVDYKLCDRDFDCEHCPFDLILQRGTDDVTSTLTALAEPIQASKEDDGHQFSLAETLFYHPRHVWVRVEDRGNVRIGLDDFAQRLLGRAYAISLPHEGIKLEKGQYRWGITHKSGETPLIIPLSGVVIEVNWKLIQSPSLLNRDPYGEGWAFMMKPSDLKTGLRDLFYGSRAVNWNRAEMERLYSRTSELLGTASIDGISALPDGGVLRKDFLSELSAEQMNELISLFLPGPRVLARSNTRRSAISDSKRR